MILQSISLQNFRNYSKTSFDFSATTTIIIGANGVGKSNLIESIFLLATGKSFRASPPAGGEKQLIQFGKQIARVKGLIVPSSRATKERGDLFNEIASSQAPRNDETSLEVVFADQGTAFLKKKYLVNGVARRRADFAGNLTAVLFTPEDLDLVSGQPGNRRRFLDEVLVQVDSDYHIAHTTYTKALRQRNALLEQVQETGARDEKLFSYWDELLIRTGSVIMYKREEFIEFLNAKQKDFFPCLVTYDKSVISKERLLQYKDAEVGAGVTLVGPHRDDLKCTIYNEQFTNSEEELLEARYFASRGQQRLIVLELKMAQIAFLQAKTQTNPLLILDDIFSELDSQNIAKILSLLDHHQVIITTTHKEFVEDAGLKNVEMIELNGKT